VTVARKRLVAFVIVDFFAALGAMRVAFVQLLDV
jgi:hypothetical protein